MLVVEMKAKVEVVHYMNCLETWQQIYPPFYSWICLNMFFFQRLLRRQTLPQFSVSLRAKSYLFTRKSTRIVSHVYLLRILTFGIYTVQDDAALIAGLTAAGALVGLAGFVYYRRRNAQEDVEKGGDGESPPLKTSTRLFGLNGHIGSRIIDRRKLQGVGGKGPRIVSKLVTERTLRSDIMSYKQVSRASFDAVNAKRYKDAVSRTERTRQVQRCIFHYLSGKTLYNLASWLSWLERPRPRRMNFSSTVLLESNGCCCIVFISLSG